MKKTLIAACAAVFLAPAAVLAADDIDKDEPIELTAKQMGLVTAGDLTLSNDLSILCLPSSQPKHRRSAKSRWGLPKR